MVVRCCPIWLPRRQILCARSTRVPPVPRVSAVPRNIRTPWTTRAVEQNRAETRDRHFRGVTCVTCRTVPAQKFPMRATQDPDRIPSIRLFLETVGLRFSRGSLHRIRRCNVRPPRRRSSLEGLTPATLGPRQGRPVPRGNQNSSQMSFWHRKHADKVHGGGFTSLLRWRRSASARSDTGQVADVECSLTLAGGSQGLADGESRVQGVVSQWLHRSAIFA